jgi:hypothetical protein
LRFSQTASYQGKFVFVHSFILQTTRILELAKDFYWSNDHKVVLFYFFIGNVVMSMPESPCENYLLKIITCSGIAIGILDMRT